VAPNTLAGVGQPTPGRTAQERRAAADERRERRAGVTDLAIVMEAAGSILAVRPRSVAEMRRRLRHLGYRADLCDQAVDRLSELGYLDDEELARAWVERRDRSRPRGELVLRRELRARGIPDDAIAAALRAREDPVVRTERGDASDRRPEGAGSDESDGASGDERAARRLVERRRASLMRDPDPRRRRQRAYALLARNGFDPDLCQRVAAALGDADAAV
jgi:regulatory protein